MHKDEMQDMINETDIAGMMPQTPHEKVGDFIYAFGASLDPRLWIRLVDEELKELYAEVPGTTNHLKELADLLYVSCGLTLTATDHVGSLMPEEERTKVVKQQSQVQRALSEYLLYYGEDVFAEAFDRVHNSNMSKLGVDGKPIKRDDGKVLKGPNYKEPDLTDLVRKE